MWQAPNRAFLVSHSEWTFHIPQAGQGLVGECFTTRKSKCGNSIEHLGALYGHRMGMMVLEEMPLYKVTKTWTPGLGVFQDEAGQGRKVSFCYASQDANRKEDHSVFAGISFPCAFFSHVSPLSGSLGVRFAAKCLVLASHNMLLLRTIDLILYILLSLWHMVCAHFMFENTQNE